MPFSRTLSYEDVTHKHAILYNKTDTHAPPHTCSLQHPHSAADTSSEAPALTSQIIVQENRHTCSPPSHYTAAVGAD